jgi:methylenetetrahydrofolate/methylenetetrahydromethanopterin dehydrogenase (NADP+)
MSDKHMILIHLDTDPQPSVFDRVVAIDAGAQELFSYGGVTPAQVQGFVHGAIFTRGPKDLKHTAIFLGGSDVAAAERLLVEVQKHLLPNFGLQVSVMLDPNGCNTTAVAAVRSASKHLDLTQTKSLVLGGTGPVGQRVALLLALQGGHVRLGSRQVEKAAQACQHLRNRVPKGQLEPVGTGDPASLAQALADRDLVVSAGAIGAHLLSKATRAGVSGLKVMIDLNAVPPLGIEGLEVTDRATDRDGISCYGAIGVGGLKMKIHKAAIARLFHDSHHILDAETIYALAENLLA